MSPGRGAVVYQALGYCFGTRLTGTGGDFLGPALDWAFQGLRSEHEAPPDHFYTLAAGPGPMVRLERDRVVLQEEVSEWVALSALMADLNARAVASRPDHLVVHAGAVSAGGSGLLLPADSGSGKTTLTAALVTAGCDYLTDEAASVDLDRLLVEPYAKPLSLSPSSQTALGCGQSELGPMELVPASWLRPGCWSGPVRPGSIVFPTFRPEAPAGLARLSRGEALVELANNSFNFVDHGGRWLPRLRDLVAACGCWRLTFGNAIEAAALIVERVL